MGDADQPHDDPTGELAGEPSGNGSSGHGSSGNGHAEQPLTTVDRSTLAVDAEQQPRLPFTVVGIGASAGGLEALTEFFEAFRPDAGMAFVVVQHLPPQRESLMVEILARHTRMPVSQVEDGMAVEPNRVYVIRPGNTLTIRRGLLHLGEPLEARGHQRPVDDFFRSLAQEQRQRAVGVILSGMGSNGTAGAQMIKAVGGVCVAQDPDTAKFPSMPRSLIDAGVSDYILRPRDMADALVRYSSHPYVNGSRPGDAAVRREHKQLGELLALLRTRTRHDFSGYKKPTLVRRIQRRMGLNHVTQLADYLRLLRQTPAEATALSDDLMIHVTGFFRDPEAWEALRTTVVVPLVAQREVGAEIRCWITACSSGEEAYTLGMLLVEEAERVGKHFDLKIFATDTAERSLASARAGIYPGGIESEITPERLGRFFDKDDSSYRIRRDLRELVVFAPQNVLQDAPFSRMDICTCRNLLIYLEPDVQRKVLLVLHFALVSGGAMFLGTSETLGGAEDLFEPVDKKARVFRRVGATRHHAMAFPQPALANAVLPRGSAGIGGNGHFLPAEPGKGRPTVAGLTQRLLLERYTPPSVVVDREFRIVYFHGKTDAFLDQPQGEPTRDVLALARVSVRGPIRTALYAAVDRNEAGVARDGTLRAEDGTVKRITIRAVPLEPRPGGNLFLVSFTEEPEPNPTDAQPGDPGTADSALRQELDHVRNDLQSTIEALQSSNEELKASNEEVTSINEELQSTNEELETSKEELQSLNEELITVNAQLGAKMDELQSTTNDLTSLLSSTDIAVVFLDTNFRIRRFTPAVRDLIELIAGDIGRPLRDLNRKFDDPHLLEDAAAVLERLVPVEREVVSESGRAYVRRALPYRTTDNRIAGVVLTFIDVTERQRADRALGVSEQRLQRVVEISSVGVVFLDTSGAIDDANDEFLRLSGYSAEDLHAGRLRWDRMTPPDWLDRSRAAMAELRDSGRIGPYETQYVRKDGSRWWALVAGSTLSNDKAVEFIVDVTERRRAEAELRTSAERLRLAVEATHMGFWEMNPRTGVDSVDATHNRIMGLPLEERTGSLQALTERVHPDDRTRLTDAIQRAVDGSLELAVEFRVVWPDGSVHHVAKFGRVVPDPTEAGGVRLIGTVLDVTDRVAAGQAREDLLAREQAGRQLAEAANEAKDQFLANISHELRTPLSAILLWAKQLRGGHASEQQRREGMDAIERSADAQRELIEDLLDTSRIVSGKLRLLVRPFDLDTLMREAVEGVRPAADARRVSLDLTVGPHVAGVVADPDRLRQVIWNLLSNAVKFTPAQGRVDVHVQRHGEEVELTVADTGRGIPADQLSYVFDRFWQAESAARLARGGLGLGLAIAKQLVELHGGTIDVHSDGPDRGATFRVRLPLPGREGPARPTVRRASKEPRLTGVRLLLVEDDVPTRDALVAVLCGAGAEVTARGTVADALTAFEAEAPDLILSDIGLPDGDGNDLIRQIRTTESDRKAPATPAVALTAMVGRQDRRRSAESGFQQHLAKPIEPDQLIRTLLTLLDR